MAVDTVNTPLHAFGSRYRSRLQPLAFFRITPCLHRSDNSVMTVKLERNEIVIVALIALLAALGLLTALVSTRRASPKDSVYRR